MGRQQSNLIAARQRSRRLRRGLSFVELTIGIAITGVMMLSVAGFTVSVGTGWRHSGDEAKARNVKSRAGQQMETAIGGMLSVLQLKAGSTTGDSAYMFYWQSDAATGKADSKAQFGEMALIEYEPSTKSVWLYQVKPQSDMTAAQKTTAINDNWGDPTSPAIVTYFKGSDIVAPRIPIVGGTPASSGGVDVTSATFGYFTATGAKPLVSFRIGLQDAQTQTAASGNVALHSAQTPSNLP